MVVKARDQTKENFCVALLNRRMHSNSICPGNHDVCYGYGWFRIDSKDPFQDPALTAKADELMENGATVYYSPTWNTYVLPNAEYFTGVRDEAA